METYDSLQEFIKKIFENINHVIDLPNEDKRHHLNKCLIYNKDISIFLRKQKIKHLSDISEYYDFVNEHYVILKNEIQTFISNISDTISSKENILKCYISYFSDLELIIQCISLIFSELINEIILNDTLLDAPDDYLAYDIKSPIYEFIYKKWFSLVYCRFNFKFNSNMNDLINNLRNHLTSHSTITNIIEILSKDKIIDSSYSYLMDTKIIENIYSVETFINSLEILDEFIDNNETIHSFRSHYNSCCRNLYLYFNNSISMIKDHKDKITEMIKILLIETFINNLFIFDSENSDKILINYLFSNLNYLDEYVDHIFIKYKSFNLLVNKIIECYSNSYTDENLNKMEQFMNTFLEHDHISIILVKLLEYRPEKYINFCTYLMKKIIICISTYLTSDITIEDSIRIFSVLNIFNTFVISEIENSNYDYKTTEGGKKILVTIKNTLNNNIYEMMEILCNNNQLDIDFSTIIKYIPKLFDIFDNLDEHELRFKKILCKKLLLNNFQSILNFTRLETLSYNINNFNLTCSLKIIKSIKESENCSRDIEFTQSMPINSINLKVFPDGITPLKSDEHDPTIYKSDTFKRYVVELKSKIRQSYIDKFMDIPRKLAYNDCLSSVDLELAVNGKSVICVCRYSQVDILFYLQNEYEQKYNQLFNSQLDSRTKEMIEDDLLLENKEIKKLRFINVLFKKKILVSIDSIIQINNKLSLKENKSYNFTKIKEDQFVNPNQKNQDEEEHISKITSKLHNNLLFHQTEYINVFIIRYCKSNKEHNCLVDDIHQYVETNTKSRFKFTRDQLLVQVKKLVEDLFIEKISDDQYKYIINY